MCNFLSSQKPAFTCKGRCSTCVRNITTTGEHPRLGETGKLIELLARPSGADSFGLKTENSIAGNLRSASVA